MLTSECPHSGLVQDSANITDNESTDVVNDAVGSGAHALEFHHCLLEVLAGMQREEMANLRLAPSGQLQPDHEKLVHVV